MKKLLILTTVGILMLFGLGGEPDSPTTEPPTNNGSGGNGTGGCSA